MSFSRRNSRMAAEHGPGSRDGRGGADADQRQCNRPPPSFGDPIGQQQPGAKCEHRSSRHDETEHGRTEQDILHETLREQYASTVLNRTVQFSPVRVMCQRKNARTLASMDTSLLLTLSDRIADVVSSVAASVVQVQGRRRPASGIAYGDDVVLTTARALGREEGLHVAAGDGRVVEAELAGWDPATGIAVLRTPGLGLPPVSITNEPARVGQIGIAVARSWSNALTASAGIVAVIGGPLRTGRGQSIEQVIRTTAPMHDGFAGGAFMDASGRVAGVATAAAIRGLGVIIPASIAWRTAAEVLQHGRPKRGYVGLSGQPVQLATRQQQGVSRERGLLITGLTPDGPADRAGLLVGDVILDFDGKPIESSEELLDLLTGDRVGRNISLRLVRAGKPQDVTVTVAERQVS
jgi:serine protease Do